MKKFILYGGIVVAVLLSFSHVYSSSIDDSIKDHYDVIVVGGEPEGVAAAVSAARNGAEVLLIESRDALGGLFTFGELNYLDLPQDYEGNLTSRGIFLEWWKMVGKRSVFDIEKAREAFRTLIEKEENIDLLLSSQVEDVKVDKDKIKELTVKNEKELHTITAKNYIDATADADLAAMAGVPYTIGQEDFGRDEMMSATLVIHLKNVDWEKVKEVAETGMLGRSAATHEAAWGFWEIEELYEETQEDVNLRGLNIGRTENDDVYINALQIFNVDGLDEDSKEAAIEKGKKETDHIVEFLRKEFPGFEQAEIASYPEELYIRETRHLNSLYRVTASDVWEHRIFEDTVAIGAYPVDIQATSPDNLGYIVLNPNYYGIPFRSLVPENIKNLLVTSRSGGYDSIPAGSIRVIPTGMAVAEAGGVAAVTAIKEGIDFHELSRTQALIKDIQYQLKEQGAYLPESKEQPPYLLQGDPDYESIRKIYSLGLISAGYENEVPLEKKLTVETFAKLLRSVFKQTFDQEDETKHVEKLQQWKDKYDEAEGITKSHIQSLLSHFPEKMDQASWVETVHGEFTYREGYRLLALWIPSE